MKRKIIFSLFLAVLAAGCFSLESLARSRLNFINYTASVYLPKPKDYPVDLFFDGSPVKQYEVIGEIIGDADDGSQVRPFLEARVRQVGGDGAFNIATKQKTKKETEIVEVRQSDYKGRDREFPVAKTNYYDVIKISAKVIRYK